MKKISRELLTRVGFINKTHGYKGMLHCVTDITDPEKLLKLEFLFIMINGLPVPYFIEEMEVGESDFLVKLEEIESETAGKKLSGFEVYAEKIKSNKKNLLMSWKDVKDFMAIDEEYGEIGKIEEVLEYPMQYIAKCTVNEKEVLFPLNDDVVSEVNEEARTVHLNLPGGLLDIYLT